MQQDPSAPASLSAAADPDNPITPEQPANQVSSSEQAPIANAPKANQSGKANSKLAREYDRLQQNLKVCEQQLSRAKAEVTRLRNTVHHNNDWYSDTLGHFETTKRILANEIASKSEQNELLKQDNATLRAVIANSKSSAAPCHEESYYVEHLDGLNHLIQSSVAKAFKQSCNQNLSEEAGNTVLDIISSIDPWGKQTVETLSRVTIWTLHKDARKRIALVRHIIALFLWDSVFDPFAFGLEKNISENLRAVEDNLSSGSIHLS